MAGLGPATHAVSECEAGPSPAVGPAPALLLRAQRSAGARPPAGALGAGRIIGRGEGGLLRRLLLGCWLGGSRLGHGLAGVSLNQRRLMRQRLDLMRPDLMRMGFLRADLMRLDIMRLNLLRIDLVCLRLA